MPSIVVPSFAWNYSHFFRDCKNRFNIYNLAYKHGKVTNVRCFFFFFVIFILFSAVCMCFCLVALTEDPLWGLLCCCGNRGSREAAVVSDPGSYQGDAHPTWRPAGRGHEGPCSSEPSSSVCEVTHVCSVRSGLWRKCLVRVKTNVLYLAGLINSVSASVV